METLIPLASELELGHRDRADIELSSEMFVTGLFHTNDFVQTQTIYDI